MERSTLIFIPAKYNSTRLPQKNFRKFFGALSLLQIAMLRGLNANCGTVVVSSEEPEEVMSQIERLGLQSNNDIFVHSRPNYLSHDPATILDVVRDYVAPKMKKKYKKIAVVLPTSPFNTAKDIKKAFVSFNPDQYQRLLSVSENLKPPFNSWNVDPAEGTLQALTPTFPQSKYKFTQSTRCPTTFMSNGCVSVYSTARLSQEKNIGKVQPFVMNGLSIVDIDYEHEFALASSHFPVWNQESFIKKAAKF